MDEKPLDFGDYCLIEMHRYGSDNEFYLHKVIGRLQSNAWCDVPVVRNPTETLHAGYISDVIRCIQCGVSETEVVKFRVSDVTRAKQSDWSGAS